MDTSTCEKLRTIAGSIRRVLAADKKADVDEFQDTLALVHFVVQNVPLLPSAAHLVSSRTADKLCKLGDCLLAEVAKPSALVSRARTQLEYINNAWATELLQVVIAVDVELANGGGGDARVRDALEKLSFVAQFASLDASDPDATDAGRLWGKHFAHYMSHVPAGEFFRHVAALNEANGVATSPELERALVAVLDPSLSAVVSAARVARLCSAFGPLGRIFESAATLFAQRFFHGFLSFQDTNTILGRRCKGSFLCRFSSWAVHALVMCSVMPDNTIQQAKVQSVERGKFRLDGNTYDSMLALVRAYADRGIMRFPVSAPRLSAHINYGIISSSDCQRLLRGVRVGTFLVRLSTSRPGDYVLAVCKGPGEVVQIIVSYLHEDVKEPSFALDNRQFGTMDELVRANASMLKEKLPLLRSCEPETGAMVSLSETAVADAIAALHAALERRRRQWGGGGGGAPADDAPSPYAAGFVGGPTPATGYDVLDGAAAVAGGPAPSPALAYGDTMDAAEGWRDARPSPATTYDYVSPSSGGGGGGGGAASSGYLLESSGGSGGVGGGGGGGGPALAVSHGNDYMSASDAAALLGGQSHGATPPASAALAVPGAETASPLLSVSPGSRMSGYELPPLSPRAGPLSPSAGRRSRGPLNPVQEWLRKLGLLEAYGEAFAKEDLDDLEVVATLTRQDLVDMGIATKGAQAKLLAAIGKLSGGAADGGAEDVARWLRDNDLGAYIEPLERCGLTSSLSSLRALDSQQLASATKGHVTKGGLAKLSKALGQSQGSLTSSGSGSSGMTTPSRGLDAHMFVSDVQPKQKVGAGFFGVVYKGTWQDAIDVALKQVTQDDAEGMKEFEDEVAMLLTLRHPNVIRFYGIYSPNVRSLRSSSSDNSKVDMSALSEMYMVLEWANSGSLLDFVKTADLSVKSIVSMAIDSARGMMFLAERSPPVVHRDLAMRNLLVSVEGERVVIKVADFGLSRFTTEVEEEDENAMAMYCPVKHRKPLPVRWLAPEAWYQKQFSTKSDVWSFGVVLWEMFMHGAKPYEDLADIKVMRAVANGRRLEKPNLCPNNIYEIMLECWADSPASRPTFRELYTRLREAPLPDTADVGAEVMTGAYEDLDDALDGYI